MKKTKKETVIGTVFVPDDKIEKFWELFDNYENGGRKGRYELWNFISSFCEGLKDKQARIVSNNIFHPYIEILSDEE